MASDKSVVPATQLNDHVLFLIERLAAAFRNIDSAIASGALTGREFDEKLTACSAIIAQRMQIYAEEFSARQKESHV